MDSKDITERLDAIEAAVRFMAVATVPGHPSDRFKKEAANRLQSETPAAARLLGPLLDWAIAAPDNP